MIQGTMKAAQDACVHRGGLRLERLRASAHSLRFRLTLGLILTLGATFAAFVLIHYEWHRRSTLQEARASLDNIGRVIEGSLEHAMLARDAGHVQAILDSEAQQRRIRTILLLDNHGRIRFAPQGTGVGALADLPGSGASAGGSLPPVATTTIATSGGERVLRYYSPIANKPACQTCHSPEEAFAGALVTDLSLTDTDARLRADLRASALGGLLVIAMAAIIVNLFLDRLVISRLDHMMRSMRRLGEGDRSQRLPVRDGDEISRLAAAFNDMADGLQAKDAEAARLYRELEQEGAAKAHLLRQVIRVQEEERKHIARELHDDFAQTLAALAMGLESCLQSVPEKARAVRERLARVRDLTDSTLSRTDRWIQELRPLVLDDLGLVPAIRWYAEAWLEANGVEVSLDAAGLRDRLPPELETTLFRVIQEALNNVARHAQAHKVHIGLGLANGRIFADIADDGVGFCPEEFQAVREDLRGAGLLGMRERVELVGGRIEVSSRPGDGTRVRVEVPWTP